MAIEYTLEIAGPAQCDTLATRLCSIPGYRCTTEGVISSGLHVYISQPGPLEVEMTKEEFGFTPTASVTFRRDKEADPVMVRMSLLRGCMALLEENTEGAVLLFNGETVILLRRNGKLVLNPVDGFWTDEVIVLISAPYEFEHIESI